jgi:hypothetical protein
VRPRAVAIVAAAALVLAAAASGAGPQVTRLGDGSTVTVWKDGRVVERDRHGRVTADSTCESAAVYARWVAFMRSFQAAVRSGDRARVARSVHYPLLWAGRRVDTGGKLVADYRSIFVPAVVAAIEAADPRALFCQNLSQVMLGSGVVWGDDFGGRLAVVTVNRP